MVPLAGWRNEGASSPACERLRLLAPRPSLPGAPTALRRFANYLLLLVLKAAAHLFYRFRVTWIGLPEGAAPWDEYRVVALLNHTSLFEWLFVGAVPPRFLWRIASHALVPAADETMERPLVGRFIKLLAANVVPITRKADHTWQAVLDGVDSHAMVIILPEGRMKREDGLDKNGQPMTVRGGIADILRSLDGGQMLIAYSGGLHHVQAPGQWLPRPFKTLSLALEAVDIAAYKQALGADGDPGEFKVRVKQDLERRRDLHCPVGRELWAT